MFISAKCVAKRADNHCENISIMSATKDVSGQFHTALDFLDALLTLCAFQFDLEVLHPG